VQVHVEPERAREALHGGHRAASRLADALLAREASQEAKHRAQEDPQDRAHQPGILRAQVTHAMR
jgi:hypothetical protein